MQLNASMNNTIAERFNVAGALVVKLFGKPRPRARQLRRSRASQVRDIGVTTAMYSRVLFVALGFVAAVGTAIVYYVGGNLRDRRRDHDRHHRRVRACTSARSTSRSPSSRTPASTC